jgi:hypothetical protein
MATSYEISSLSPDTDTSRVKVSLWKAQWGEVDWLVRFESPDGVHWAPVHRGDWFETPEEAVATCNDTVTAAHRLI